MMQNNAQLRFDFPIPNALGRDDFFVSSANADVLAYLKDWQNWPDKRCLLIGPPASGKTHLARIWQSQVGGVFCDTADVPKIVDCAVVIENVDHVAGHAAQEGLLFHLLNVQADGRYPLLLTARYAPQTWGIALPDLQSRLQAMMSVTLEMPDDELMMAMLGKLFNDRQILVAPNVLSFICNRIERRYDAIYDCVERLDHASLEHGRKITIQMARRILMQDAMND